MMRNLSLLTDLYEYSMANGFDAELPNTRATFDVFYRKVPDQGSFVLAAGLKQIIDQLADFHFSDSDLTYFRSLNLWRPAFIDHLATLTLDCHVHAVPEGTPVFPREPLMTIEGPIAQAQLLETLILNILNHQSLIATKTRRMVFAAKGRPIMEFGARRAQGPDSAVYGARAAVIGGAASTSDVLAAKLFHIPVAGTMAHSWIEAFPDELTAFRKWAALYPDNSALLVDTYDVLTSGVPNAITVFKELRAAGHHPVGIRIDSGDIATLSRDARHLLDAAGFQDTKITISNALDESVMTSLLDQGAPIDNFGIGEKLITSASAPVLSGVYKLAAIETDGQVNPKIKISDSREKVTIPGQKQLYRLYRKSTREAFADLITGSDEQLSNTVAVVDSNPLSVNRVHHLSSFDAELILLETPIDPAQCPSDVHAIRQYSQQRLAELPAATQRLVNPDSYHVYMTTGLADLQHDLIARA
nr:nicotinate phosphoribosyltransferase [Secundilactobacillus paracollinoides]